MAVLHLAMRPDGFYVALHRGVAFRQIGHFGGSRVYVVLQRIALVAR
jgi:hypothetical protein